MATAFRTTCGVLALIVVLTNNSTSAVAADPALPTIADKSVSIFENGALADGTTSNTAAIQKTIDAVAATGGGTVVVPEGRFLTGPLTLASGINLHLDKGATLLIENDIERYPVSQGRAVNCISVAGAHDIKLSGEGTIDGQGEPWWKAFRSKKTLVHRPYMVQLRDCSRVLIEGVTLTNSPMFHLVPQNCTDVTIRGITIQSPADAPNTDGIDPSGWNYLITDCTIDDGDDNIAIKPNPARQPGNKNFVITNCKFLHGHGMSVGSGTNGGIEDLIVSNCTFDSTDAGIRIKTVRGRGGLLQNLIYENLTMTRVKNPIYICDYYPEHDAPKDPSTETAQPLTDTTPIIKNIIVRNVTATDSTNAGIIRGLPEAPITDMTLVNVSITAKSKMKIYFAKGIKFVDSKIEIDHKGSPLDTHEAEVTGIE
jgi:polygalacturonase